MRWEIHALERGEYHGEGLGPRAEQCVFADDLMPDIDGARAVGMTAVHHTDGEQTVTEHEALLGTPLRG